MTEPPGLLGVVVAHSGVAQALVDAAEEITGVRDALVAVSNTDCDRVALEGRVVAAMRGEPAIIFVDLPSGSCFQATLHHLHDRETAVVVTGVNLAMLLDFLFHRQADPRSAMQRAAEVGTKAIRPCPSS